MNETHRPSATSSGPQPRPPSPRQAPRQVRSAARIVRREARSILRKHGARVAAEPAAQMQAGIDAIDRLYDADDTRALQTEVEQLDELLEQHASFARKSALRETLENVGVAVLIALGLRSCLYEPFKIPSGSMMPTLLTGDHIFVNKFVYGVQVPFTTTVVGDSIGHIERGDVIVFRYPLDETQDFIKRVVGLPGDEIRVAGRRVEIKRAEDDDFQVLAKQKLDRRCLTPEGDRPIANCSLYEETNVDDKTYVVRYRFNSESQGDLAPPAQVWKVPEGHLMVMGDNRNDSLDSRRWTVQVEAVKADGLLSTKDLRDLTDERLFSMTRPASIDAQGDWTHDHVVFKASHRALDHDIGLEVWRDPNLGIEAIEAAKRAELGNSRPITWDSLVSDSTDPETQRQRALGDGIDAVYVAEEPDTRVAMVRMREPAALLVLRCGRAICPDEATLAQRMSEVLERFSDRRGREARELLVRPTGGDTSYSSQFRGRNNPRDHFYERRFAATGAEGRRSQVRLRAFRRPDEGTELIRDAALHHLGIAATDPTSPPEVDEAGLSTWFVEDQEAWVSLGVDLARHMVVVLECGKAACGSKAKAHAMAQGVFERLPKAAGDRRRMPQLLGIADVGGLPEVPLKRATLAEYDRVRLDATIKGDRHSVELQAWRKPDEGVNARVEALVAELGDMEPDDSALDGAFIKAEDDAIVFVFAVSESETVVRMRCFNGLCPTRQSAVALARRAANRARDPQNFIDPDAERPQPFVPRGNVKGRADRIWLPLSRFWLAIR